MQSSDPQRIELRTGGFEHIHDLHGRAVIAGCETLVVGDAPQSLERLAVCDARQHCVQRGEFGQEVFPMLDCLVLGGRKRAVTRPARMAQQF